MVAKSEDSREAFHDYLQSGGEHTDKLLPVYLSLSALRAVHDDNISSRTAGLVWKLKTEYEEFKVMYAELRTMLHKEQTNEVDDLDPQRKALTEERKIIARRKSMSYQSVAWECLGKLRLLDFKNTPLNVLRKSIENAEMQVLHKLIPSFEGFLQSNHYKSWQNQRLNEVSKQTNGVKKPRSAPTYSAIYPHILVVDDSPVTVKLVGRTLETDGHQVDRAVNGVVALKLMKMKTYDVVLIDINMPVLDGYEAVRLFRQHEKEKVMIANQSEVSSLSGDGNDSTEEETDNKTALEDTSPPANIVYPGYGDTGSQNLNFTNLVNSHTNKVAPGIFGGTFDNVPYEPGMKAKPSSTSTLAITKESSNPALTRESLMNLNHNEDSHMLDRLKLTSLVNPTSKAMLEFHTQFIIGMSSNVDECTKKQALDCGMDYFLPKPFTIDKFMEAIRVGNQGSF